MMERLGERLNRLVLDKLARHSNPWAEAFLNASGNT
jgi:hypothetical protein